jgi:hypothetical protein
MRKVGFFAKIILWLALAFLAYLNWRAGYTIYGLGFFQGTRALWRNADSLFICKGLALFIASFEGVGLTSLSPSIFLSNRFSLSPTLRDLAVFANVVVFYVIAKWDDPPKQKLLAQLNSSTSGEFRDLAKHLVPAIGSSYFRGSLAWLCEELSEVVELDKTLASISLCRHLLMLHLYVLIGDVKGAPSSPAFDDLIATAKSRGLHPEPALRQLWKMAETLLNDLFQPENPGVEATYSSLLVGTLGVAKNTALLLEIERST